MRIFLGITLALTVVMGAAASANPYEPPRGTELRQELLDLMRPLAVFDLGPPVEFRVLELMVDGDVAFARLIAQRPGGGAIDMTQTPMVEWRYVDPFEIDGPRFEAFFIRRDGYWQVTNYALGATDAWWFGYHCDVFGSLLQDYGC